jgi:hypothetical protein
MKDFLGRTLAIDDIVAFVRPLEKKLRKGYVIREQGGKIKVKFWSDTKWDSDEIFSNAIVLL